jgi:hypothetical protein
VVAPQGCSGVSNGAQVATSGVMSAAPVNQLGRRQPELRQLELRQQEQRNHNSLAAVHRGDLLSSHCRAAFGMRRAL